MKVYLKVILSLVVIVAVLLWAVDSVRAGTYSGTDLNVELGKGAVTVTNPDAAPVDVQLVSAGTRSFTVSSSIDGVSGSSTTQGEGTARTQLFEFAAPSGASEFTVTRSTNVSLGLDRADQAGGVCTTPHGKRYPDNHHCRHRRHSRRALLHFPNAQPSLDCPAARQANA